MKKGLGLYYLGATIVAPDVLSRVQTYIYWMQMLFGTNCTVEEETHITIIPPFYADYETASAINLSCAISTLSSDHPITKTQFSIRGMSVMPFEDLDVIHFPVGIHPQPKIRIGFVNYVKMVRQKMNNLGIEFKGAIPLGYNPHITVLTRKAATKDERLNKIIEKSGKEPFLFFRSGYPTLYAKYPRLGWQTLSQDPSLMK